MLKKYPVLALLLVIAIDSMNFGFIFPVLTPMFFGGNSPILSSGISLSLRDFLYGLTVAVFPLFMFIGAPILGDLSDYVGRKRVLFICLAGTGVGYLVSGIGVSSNLLSLIILGRILSGLTAGALPLAQAAIADVSHHDPKRQARYMGLMMFAIAGGQVLGPSFAGFFSDKNIAFWFSNSLPFYLAVVLTLFNLIWLQIAFQETHVIHAFNKLSITKTFHSYKQVFTSRSLFLMSLVFLCMQFSWSFYSQATPAYLQRLFHYSNFALGLFSASLGVFIAIGGTLIMPALVKRITTKQGCMIALFAMAIGVFLGSFPSQIFFWIGVMINAIGAALAFSFIITLFSTLVDNSKQGWVMGITGAIIAAAWTITALLTGIILVYSPVAAEYLASLFALLGMGIVSRK